MRVRVWVCMWVRVWSRLHQRLGVGVSMVLVLMCMWVRLHAHLYNELQGESGIHCLCDSKPRHSHAHSWPCQQLGICWPSCISLPCTPHGPAHMLFLHPSEDLHPTCTPFCCCFQLCSRHCVSIQICTITNLWQVIHIGDGVSYDLTFSATPAALHLLEGAPEARGHAGAKQTCLTTGNPRRPAQRADVQHGYYPPPSGRCP